MPVLTKICGLSTPDTLDAAISGGASHIGFVFFDKSPRNLTAEQAGALAKRVARRAKVIGLFVDPRPDHVSTICKEVALDIIQLHGNEHPALASHIGLANALEVWKAIPVRTSTDLAQAQEYRGSVQRILYDAKPPKGADLPGGNGLRFDWNLLQGYHHPLPWALSGGLNPDNLAQAVQITGATLVDVSSGVEQTPGIKNVDKIAAFLKAASQL
jgi:phosphoribosylanthranilate isomerase